MGILETNTRIMNTPSHYHINHSDVLVCIIQHHHGSKTLMYMFIKFSIGLPLEEPPRRTSHTLLRAARHGVVPSHLPQVAYHKAQIMR